MTPLTRRSFLTAAGSLAAGAAFGCGRDSYFGPGASSRFEFVVDPEAGPMINAFAGDLYAKLRSEKGNVFFSPYSISTALGMTATGAKGETLSQMQKVLHLPADAGQVDSRFAGLMAALSGKDRGYQLTTANAIWAQRGFPWRESFKERVARYGAGLQDTDFATKPDAERLAVNAWVEKQTRDKIKDLFQPGTIDSHTRMVLANAIYFKGDWAEQFDKRATKPAPFTSSDGTKKDASLMYRKGTFSLFQTDDLQVLSLPYKGKDLSMIVALPSKPNGLPALEEKLNAEAMKTWIAGLRPTSDLQVYLPKFKVETEYTLNKALVGMGMKDAFSESAADFGNMYSGDERLHISLVVHKAYVEVNEEGTEAAAATGVAMRVTSAIVEKPKIFRADHPFIFAIRHNATGAILFLGRVERP